MSHLVDPGACLSYLHPNVYHSLVLRKDAYLVHQLFAGGAGLVCVNTTSLTYLFRAQAPFAALPLCTSPLADEVSLASLNKQSICHTYDAYLLAHNRSVHCYLKTNNYKQRSSLLEEVSAQPHSMYNLAFVVVSSVTGTSPERTELVNIIPKTGAVERCPVV